MEQHQFYPKHAGVYSGFNLDVDRRVSKKLKKITGSFRLRIPIDKVAGQLEIEKKYDHQWFSIHFDLTIEDLEEIMDYLKRSQPVAEIPVEQMYSSDK